jgi:hypothetical protein
VTENPLIDVGGLEAQMSPNLQEWDTSLVDESPHESLADGHSLSNLAHVDQLVGRRLHNRQRGASW